MNSTKITQLVTINFPTSLRNFPLIIRKNSKISFGQMFIQCLNELKIPLEKSVNYIIIYTDVKEKKVKLINNDREFQEIFHSEFNKDEQNGYYLQSCFVQFVQKNNYKPDLIQQKEEEEEYEQLKYKQLENKLNAETIKVHELKEESHIFIYAAIFVRKNFTPRAEVRL